MTVLTRAGWVGGARQRTRGRTLVRVDVSKAHLSKEVKRQLKVGIKTARDQVMSSVEVAA